MGPLRGGIALLLYLACSASTAAAQPVNPLKAAVDSPFIQRLKQRPLTAELRDIRMAALLFHFSGNNREGELLDNVNRRRALATLTGEPFDMPPTVAAAIESEAANAEALKAAVEKALLSVRIDYASPKIVPPPPAPQEKAKHRGNGIWVVIGDGTPKVYMPLVIRNGLKEPATEVGLQIGKTEGGAPRPYYLFLNCKPDGAESFAPGVSQRANCSGMEYPGGMEGALQALLKRDIRAPLPANSFKSHVAELMRPFMRFDTSDSDEVGQARQMLAAASCADLGTCREIAQREDAKQREEDRPRKFLAMALLGVMIAAFAAWRVRPRPVGGWFIPAVATAVVGSSLLATVAMYALLSPGVGMEGLIYGVVILYGGIPHALGVLIVGGSLLAGNATRYRVFAAVLGILTPAVILGTFLFGLR